MLFSNPDYPLFLIAVFFLYALSRLGGTRGAIGRAAVMLLLGDVVVLLVAKDLDVLWDPVGGLLLRFATGDDLGAGRVLEAGAFGLVAIGLVASGLVVLGRAWQAYRRKADAGRATPSWWLDGARWLVMWGVAAVVVPTALVAAIVGLATDRLPLDVLWRWPIGLAVIGGAIALARVRGGWIASERGQRYIARGIVGVLAAVGATVAIASSCDELDGVTRQIVAYGHLVVLAITGIGIGASQIDAHRPLGRVVILFVASSLFYHAWAAAMPGPYRYLLALLLGTIVLDYYLAIWIENTEDPIARKVLVIVSLCSNLGILVFFKYTDFFTQDVLHLPVGKLALILPAGISFHTFQSLSYTIDVYRKQLKATRSVVKFATFVLFFPQLVAGPIVRAQDLLPQLDTLPALELEKATDGLFRIVVGLFKKIALADALALVIVDRVFEAPERYSAVEVIAGVYAYALQIYLDFSAYSDIAIGSAQILGFSLPENFRAPYRSANLQEFWRRWHISLSTWLRDYLYISLGGSKGRPSRTYMNLIATMLLGGLWHGASWAFIVWGALHGFGLAVTRYFQRATRKDAHERWSLLAGCALIALLGLAVQRFAMDGLGTWPQLVVTWLYLTPLWAVGTAWLGNEPEPAVRAPPPVPPPPAIPVADEPYRGVVEPVVDTAPMIPAWRRKARRYTLAAAAAVTGVVLAALYFRHRAWLDAELVYRLVVVAVPLGVGAVVGHALLSPPVWDALENPATRIPEVLRLAMCAAGVGFLAALQWAPTWTWIPLACVPWALGLAADLVERGSDDALLDLAMIGRRVVSVLLVFNYVCLAWVFFRATSFDNALAVLRQIAIGETDHANLVPIVTIAIVVGFLCHFFANGSFRWLRDRFVAMPHWGRGLLLAAIALVLRELGHTKIVPFIYFQF